MYDKSFFSAFCWYKDKIFSKKDSFYSLHADSYDIVVIEVHQLDFDKRVRLTSPLFICHLEELRHKAVTPDDGDALEKDKHIQLFIKVAFSFIHSLLFRHKTDYNSYIS